MCPEATVAGLYYLTALAITRTVNLFETGQNGEKEERPKCQSMREKSETNSRTVIHERIVLECAQSGKSDYLLESVARQEQQSVAAAAENPSPHFRIIYFRLRHIFLHHPAATSLYYSLILVNQRSRQEFTQYACKTNGSVFLSFRRLTHTSAVKPANAATTYTAVPLHCAMPRLQRRERS